MKTLLLAAAFATVCASAVAIPAFADVTNAKTEASTLVATPRDGEHRGEHGEAMREHFKAKMEQEHAERKGEFEALRNSCKSSFEAAKGPAAKQAVKTDCRAKEDTLRKKFYDERTAEINARRAKMDEMHARHQEMKAKAEAPAPAVAK